MEKNALRAMEAGGRTSVAAAYEAMAAKEAMNPRVVECPNLVAEKIGVSANKCTAIETTSVLLPRNCLGSSSNLRLSQVFWAPLPRWSMTPSQMSCEQVMQPGFMRAKLGSLTMMYMRGCKMVADF